MIFPNDGTHRKASQPFEMRGSLVVAFFLSLLNAIVAEVTVLKIVQTIYDRSPKLRIRGSGFDADEHSIILEMSASGQPSLRVDKDFLITKDDDGLILKLLSARRYVSFCPIVVSAVVSAAGHIVCYLFLSCCISFELP